MVAKNTNEIDSLAQKIEDSALILAVEDACLATKVSSHGGVNQDMRANHIAEREAMCRN